MSVFHNNALIGAGGGAAAAAVEGPIKSLRFNKPDSAHLDKTFSSAGNRKKWTFAAWIKRSLLGANQRILRVVSGGEAGIQFRDTDKIELYDYAGGGYTWQLQTDQVFRDCSSFYHLVVAFDSGQSTSADRVSLYINGSEVTTFSTSSYPSQNFDGLVNTNAQHSIGGQDGLKFGGYMADIYFIDGSALDPTSFGAFDSNGVWQAAAYSGTFGTNGFHLLDFANESTIGHDSSGNENDFTANNFAAVAGSGTAKTITTNGSISTSVSTEPFSGAGGAVGGGTTSDYVQVSASGHSDFSLDGVFTAEWWHYRSSSSTNAFMWTLGDSSVSSGLELYWGSTGSSLNVYTNGNGVQVTATSATGWKHYAVVRDSSNNIKVYYDGTLGLTYSNSNTFSGNITFGEFYNGSITGGLLGPISNFRLVKGSAVYTSNFTPPSSALSAITNTKLLTFQGSTIVDASGASAADVDVLFDVPTNGNSSNDTGLGGQVSGNYATLNPVDVSGGITTSEGNLKVVGANSNVHIRSTIPITSGKYYWEFTHLNSGTGDYHVGVSTTTSASELGSGYLGSTATGWSIHADPGGSSKWRHNGNTSVHTFSSINQNDVVMLAVDADAGKIYVGKNGTWFNSGNPASGTGAASTNLPTDGTAIFPTFMPYDTNGVAINFGQRAFEYSAPSGFSPICTTLLPTATVPDGSDNFTTNLWSGNDAATRDITTTFPPDFVWIKSRNQTNPHFVTDSVRGKEKNLFPNTTGQEEDPPVYGMVDKFDVDGFRVKYGNHGSDSLRDVNKSGSTYVAWSWNAGANSNKTYTVTVVSDSGNKYRFDGHGTSAVTLDLAEGSTYVFDQSDSSNSGHPLRFSTTSDGTHNSGTEYTTGVTTTGTPGSAGAKTTIVVAASAPTLYYYCSSHSGMGGQANTNSTAGSTTLSGSLTANFYDQSVVWSNLLASTGTVINATNGFNGVLSNVAQAQSGSYTLTIDLSNRGFTGDVEWYNANGNVQGASLNGGTDPTGSGTSAAGWYTLGTLASGDSCAITFNGNGSTPYCAALRIGGKILVDSGVSLSGLTQYPSINSVVKANPEAGFSIVTYSVPSSGTTFSVGHGLGAAPSLIIAKDREGSNPWGIYHSALGAGKGLLFSTAAEQVNSNWWDNTNPTSSVFYLNTGIYAHSQPGIDYVAYCFTPVAGYSAFGSYTGNFSSDGPFVYTGFRPAFILFKRTTDGTEPWVIVDSARDPENAGFTQVLRPDQTSGDFNNSTANMDILSNGFKQRGAGGMTNASGKNYVWAAFAENPFQANGGLAR